MSLSSAQSVATIDEFINRVGSITKTADGSTPLSEPGSQGGETEHPVKKVDDRLQKKPEGERYHENTKDVKEDQGAPSVENAPEAKAGAARRAASVFDLAANVAAGHQKRACKCGKTPCVCKEMYKKSEGAVSTGGSAEDDQLNIGTRAAPTGEDPSCETSSAKAGKEDKKQGNMGGTGHPANTENNELDGHKWATDSPLEKLAAAMKEVGDNLCAQVSWICQNQGATDTAQAAQQYTTKQAQAPAKQSQEVDPYLAQQLGWEMAGLVNGTFDKRAADSLVVGTCEQIIKTASDDADRFIWFMHNLEKDAAGEMMPPGGGGAPGEMPPGGGGGGGGDEAAMMSALGGGAPAGGAPPGAGGGMPGAGGGAGGGEGGGDEEAMELARVLEQLGITPEELMQAMQEEQAGGGAGGAAGAGGEMPPGAGGGGMPPGAAAGATGGMESQASDNGKTRQKQAETDKFAQTRQYLTEVIQRSRARK